MALKNPHRKITHDDLNFRCSSTATEGMCLVYSSTAGYVEKSATAASKIAAGIVLQNVEARGIPLNLVAIGDDTGVADLPRNYNRNVTYQSGYVRLLKIGETTTNQITSGETPAQGLPAYLGLNGLIGTGVSGTDKVNRDCIGHFLSAKDANGYAKVWVNIIGSLRGLAQWDDPNGG